MADKPGKYATALAAINQPQEQPAGLVLPPKNEPLRGKRSREGWRARQVLLKTESIQRAEDRLKLREDRPDFSDVVQFLLDTWLDTPE